MNAHPHFHSVIPDGLFLPSADGDRLEPMEVLARLAVLVLTPYANLTQYHGIFSSRSSGALAYRLSRCSIVAVLDVAVRDVADCGRPTS